MHLNVISLYQVSLVSLELIKTELKERKFSEEKHQDTSEETEVLDLDLIEFGERRLTEDESSENLEQTPDEIEGSGDEELEVKQMEILERTNHATNLEVPQTITGPGGFSNKE